jgi:alkyl hydroperoxide reductase subunit AhpC
VRSIPAVREIHRELADDGVVVIGVHTPEFAHERNARNVAAAVKKRGITYPVALDNAWAIWRAFGVRAWPTLIVLDREGDVRYTHVGELHRGTRQWRELRRTLTRLR